MYQMYFYYYYLNFTLISNRPVNLLKSQTWRFWQKALKNLDIQ